MNIISFLFIISTKYGHLDLDLDYILMIQLKNLLIDFAMIQRMFGRKEILLFYTACL